MKGLIRINPENSFKYIGYDVLFTSRKRTLIRKILKISKSGKTIKIDHPDLNNSLQVVSRCVLVII